ncbi:Glycosyltransferase involved in cell wall bisynthesis [Nocardioides terrae]|uniref:Glycosyltransferase involved in cell wall bisynthesis n=1 Tax=Nocardioides terrae TaxID=574651 RepID=A0A1I1IIN3_9ACTN|nr:glycosyltransferase [Nocardioides terrae]SFC33643.1 Glycosyltransferase involved in cell wall bisynthesis [Nocardioides terrae]
MRISLVSEHANPLAALGGADAGGQNVHVAALAAGLARRGHDVVVHTRRDNVSAPERLSTSDGYVVHHVLAGPPTDVPKDEMLPLMTEFGQRLGDTWRVDPPDVVHAHFWMSGLASVAGVVGTDIPVLQTFHALGSVKRRHQGRLDTSPPGRVGLERRLCREVDRVIATCRDEVDELAALGMPACRADVIPCGVDTSLFTPGPRASERAAVGGSDRARERQRLVVVGRLVTRKGIGNAIEALARLRHDGRDVELVIAGGPAGSALDVDPEVERLRELAERLRVTDRVVFLGGLARADVPDLMRSADVVVTVPWYEPFGIVPLEAMACGRPVVGSAVGGLLDTIVPGGTGELVPPRDPEALADVLGELLDDPERRRRYGEAGRERAVSLYDWSNVVARTEAVYEEVVRGRAISEKEIAR